MLADLSVTPASVLGTAVINAMAFSVNMFGNDGIAFGAYKGININNTATCNTAYGLFIQAVSGGTTSWGIWDASGKDWVLDADDQKIKMGEGQEYSFEYTSGGVAQHTITSGQFNFIGGDALIQYASDSAVVNLTISNDTINKQQALDLVESNNADPEFGVNGSFGFRFLYDGDPNTLKIQSSLGATVTDRLTITRDTGAVTIPVSLDVGLLKFVGDNISSSSKVSTTATK